MRAEIAASYRRLKQGWIAAAAAVIVALLPGSSFHVAAAAQSQVKTANGGSSISSQNQVQPVRANEYLTIADIDEEKQVQIWAVAEAQEAERLSLNLPSETLRVSQDGKGDYTTIQAAVDAAHNGDLLLISPGIYKEHVNVRYKMLAIAGTTGNPDDVIIESGGNDYFATPLDMCRGILQNITVHATDEGTETVDGLRAYALHCDFFSEENYSLVINNCHFISDVNTTIGLGTRKNYSLTFQNCTIENRGAGSAVFLHDLESLQPYQLAGTQKVTFDGCNFISQRGTAPILVMMSEELCDGAARITFRNNRVEGPEKSRNVKMYFFDSSDPQRQLGRNHFCGSSDWVLTEDSAGNDLAVLNYH